MHDVKLYRVGLNYRQFKKVRGEQRVYVVLYTPVRNSTAVDVSETKPRMRNAQRIFDIPSFALRGTGVVVTVGGLW